MTTTMEAVPNLPEDDNNSVSLGSLLSFYRELPPQYASSPRTRKSVAFSKDASAVLGRDNSVLSLDSLDNDNENDQFCENEHNYSEKLFQMKQSIACKSKQSPDSVTTQSETVTDSDTESISISMIQRRQLLSDLAFDFDCNSNNDVTSTNDAGDDASDDESVVSTNRVVNGDRIQVAIRLKPRSAKELESERKQPRNRSLLSSMRSLKDNSSGDSSSEGPWQVDSEKNTIKLNSTSRKHSTPYQFDSIFDESAATERVYKKMFQPTVRAVLTGRHATVFAYGQTGSGKTYTMQGDESKGAHGLIQLAASDLFEQVKKDNSRDYTVRIKFFEIYNEQIRDLLAPDANNNEDSVVESSRSSFRAARRKSSSERKLQIYEDKQGQPTVDAYEEEVFSMDDVLRLLQEGNSNRAKESTLMNQNSSRSHAIFRLSLESRKIGEETKKVAVLNLVDLAGSENSTNSGSTGMRLREGGKINQSLLSLSRVIHSLSLPKSKRPKHIGFRDSNLTRILQPHLSGNACMAIMCCVSMTPAHVEETRSTLKFAHRAKEVEMAPQVNEVADHSAQVAMLQNELAETKKALMELEKCFLHQLSRSQGSPSKWLQMVMSTGTDTAGTSGSESDYSDSTCTNSSESGDVDNEDDMNHHVIERSQVTVYEQPVVGKVLDFPVNEVVVLDTPLKTESDIRARLIDAERRALFLQEKLEVTDDLVESLFLELEQLRRFNKELKYRNDQLVTAHLRREEGESDLILLIKYTFYLGFSFYLAGQNELFMATMMFLWLSLEVAV